MNRCEWVIYDEEEGCSLLLKWFIEGKSSEYSKSLEVYAKLCLVSLIKGKIVFLKKNLLLEFFFTKLGNRNFPY
jgi:hypothetical protein